MAKKMWDELMVEWAKTPKRARLFVLAGLRWNSPGSIQKAHRLAKRLLKACADPINWKEFKK